MGEKFYMIPTTIFTRQDLRPADKVIYMAIADRIGNNGQSWPGMRRIAADARVSKTTAIKSVARLEELRIIEVERRGNGRQNHYRLPAKSGPETGPDQKLDRSNNATSTGPETGPQPDQKLDHNETQERDSRTKPKKTRSPKVNGCPYSKIAVAWNDLASAHNLPKIRLPLAVHRKTKLMARWREPFFRENWQAALEAIPQSPFLLGTSDRGWKVNFDFFVANDLNCEKVLSGQYADGNGRAGSSPVDSENNYAALLAAQPEGAHS